MTELSFCIVFFTLVAAALCVLHLLAMGSGPRPSHLCQTPRKGVFSLFSKPYCINPIKYEGTEAILPQVPTSDLLFLPGQFVQFSELRSTPSPSWISNITSHLPDVFLAPIYTAILAEFDVIPVVVPRLGPHGTTFSEPLPSPRT
jgi:hypothetical protein